MVLTMANKPRITGHQLFFMYGIRDTEIGASASSFHIPMRAKSWINEKGNRVWNFSCRPGLNKKKGKNLYSGDPWDTQTGESLLRKGIIEPSFSMIHDGSYPYADTEIQFYRLTELGKQYLS